MDDGGAASFISQFLDDPKPTTLSKSQKRALRRQEKRAKSGAELKPFQPLNQKQSTYFAHLAEHNQVFAIGGAGTGKTYIAARHAIRRLMAGDVEQVIVARPTVSKAKHRQGFLPGSLEAKLAPWLVPIMDAFKQDVSTTTLDKLRQEGKIEFLSFEHMRGRSISDAVVILDEAQNCDIGDLRLFLTRIGTDTQVIVCGDVDQVDIEDSGLFRVIDMIKEYDMSARLVEFEPEDVVRSEIAKEWVKAFKAEPNLDIHRYLDYRP
jgi:phosphate starvation-inducible PhoH-like protein